MNKFKIGDRVKSILKNEYHGVRYGDIGKVQEDSYVPYVRWDRIGEIVAFDEENLIKLYTYEDLKKAPIGTKITFQNGYLIKFDKERVYGVINGIYYNGKIDYSILFLKGKVTDERFGKIIKIEEPIYQTVYEHKEEILDEAEKRYLRVVIRPFKNRVRGIEKISYSVEEEFITIIVKDDGDINLPTFKRNTMYKGMKPNKEYTLEELGL